MWRELFISADCVALGHEGCRHVCRSGSGSQEGREALACHCACHSACPASAAVRPSLPSCTCPGRLRERNRWEQEMPPPNGSASSTISAILHGMREQRMEMRARKRASKARGQFVETVARTSKGKSRDIVRGELLEEFRRHGVEPYPQPLLDNIVDTIRTDDLGEKERLISERRDMARESVSLVASALKDLKNLFENQT